MRAGNRLGFPITLYVGSVSLANGRGCARLAHAWGGWVWGTLLVWGGWAPAWGVGPADLLVRALGKYLDPMTKGICVALRTRHMGVLKFPGTVLVACRRKESRVTWRLAVQFKMR